MSTGRLESSPLKSIGAHTRTHSISLSEWSVDEDSLGTFSVAPSILLMSIAVRTSLAPDELDESGRPCEA